MKFILLLIIILFFTSCGGGGGSSSSSSTSTNITRVNPTSSADKTVLLTDEYSDYQWYRSNSFLDLDILNQSYSGYNNDNPIIVQVVDDGIEADHEDLYFNMDFSSSYNATDSTNDPTPSNLSDNQHGTSVSGVIGAIGYNSVGLKGIAPSVNLSGFALEIVNNYFIIDINTLEKAWVTGDYANNIAISNNSWGSCVSKDIDEEELLKQGTQILRDGKGRIYLFAGGNGREGDDDCPNSRKKASSNTSYLNNSQYSIAVAAVNQNNQVASYSSPGANILVSAYSGDDYLNSISTTVPEGTGDSLYTFIGDSDLNYTNTFSGTSASTPIVAGSLALVLEACPNLSYRDIKYLIAKNSTKVGTGYITNSAGLSHSNDYGFGVINPTAMINECLSGYSLLGEKKSIEVSDSIESTIFSSTALIKNLTISSNNTIEWVGLTIKSDYSFPQELEVKLISPNGTESILLHSNNHLGSNDLFNSGFRLSSQAFMGESSLGTWQVEINAYGNNGSGDLNSLFLELVGH